MASKSGGCVRRERMAKDEKWNLYGTLLHVFVRPVSQSVSQSVSWFVSSANSTTLHESTAQYQSNFLFPFVFCLFTCTYFCLVNLLRITNVCRTVNRSLLEIFQVNGMFAIEWERFRKHRKHT